MLGGETWSSVALREQLVENVCQVKCERSNSVHQRAMSKEFVYESKDSKKARFTSNPPNKVAPCRPTSHQAA